MNIVASLWYGDGLEARVGRATLAPVEQLFAFAVARRNQRFDARAGTPMALPAMSVGNLTVGGTGKTPVAAWCCARLRSFGASPAIVLRGYGDDEWRVHRLLNPSVQVLVSPDRVGATTRAKAIGADIVVLDDGFQHRQASRVVDLVLVSADSWREPVRLLPTGPFREPLRSLRRATVAIVTSKSASDEAIGRVTRAIGREAPDIPIALIRLPLGAVHRALPPDAGATESHTTDAHAAEAHATESHPTDWLRGRTVVALSAIGNPDAFEAQLRACGAEVRQAFRFADHHAFSPDDAARVARAASGCDGVVCTLKDAVKLAGVWPREAPPLWYVSQSIVVERGAEALDRAFARVLAARTATVLTAG